jgi:hypothetical protein
MATVGRNKQLNQSLGMAIQYLMNNMLLKNQNEGRMALAGKNQEYDIALKELEYKLKMEQERVGSSYNVKEAVIKAIGDLSGKPPLEQAQGMTHLATYLGGLGVDKLDTIDLPSLIGKTKEMTAGMSKGANELMAGTPTQEGMEAQYNLGAGNATNMAGYGAAGARQKENIALVEQPKIANERARIAVDQGREGRLAEGKDQTLSYITDAIKYLVGQKVEPDSEGYSATAYSVPNPLSKENQGKALYNLNKLRVKVLKGVALSDNELDWVGKVYDAATIEKEGLGEPGEAPKPRFDLAGALNKAGTWQYMGNNTWKKIA